MSIQKNSTLELFKLLASYMVVFIHVLFHGKLGIIVDALARFAVPVFFLVSGFYSYQITCQKIRKRIRNIVTLLIFATVIFNIFDIAALLYWNRAGFVALLEKYTELSTYIHFLIFNLTVNASHVWYLWAVFYVYVIFYFVTKFQVKDKVIFPVSLLLLILHILLGEGLSVAGIKLPIWYVRNFALMGIPFFSAGLFVKKYESKFQFVPAYVIFASVIIGVSETVLSRCFLGENELYIGSLFILFAIVCTFIQYKDVKYPPFLTALEGCSTYIYIFHLTISYVLYVIYGMLGIDVSGSVILENLHPLLVCVSSTVFAYFFMKLLKYFKKIQLHKAKAG